VTNRRSDNTEDVILKCADISGSEFLMNLGIIITSLNTTWLLGWSPVNQSLTIVESRSRRSVQVCCSAWIGHQPLLSPYWHKIKLAKLSLVRQWS